MNRFIVFYSRDNDARRVVRTYRRRAKSRADATDKQLSTSAVNVDLRSDPDEKFRSGRGTIECVSVADDNVVDREMNPTLDRIHEMVDELP